MSGIMMTAQNDTRRGELRLRNVLVVLFLVLMLSFDPAINTQTARADRALVEYVMPARRRRLRGRRLRGRRYRDPRHADDLPRFVSIESLYRLEG